MQWVDRLQTIDEARLVLRSLRRFRSVNVWLPVVAFGVALAAGATTAAAQGPDGLELHGFVEPCSIANVQEMYTECELCTVRQGASKVCVDQFGKRGYEKKCQSHGDVSTWNEVWCIDRRRSVETPAPSKLPFVIGAAVLSSALLLVKRALSKRSVQLPK